MDFRQKALQEFLNDFVIKTTLGLYFWHDKYYQVLPYNKVKTKLGKGHNVNQFVIIYYKDKKFALREMSDLTLKKYYPKYFK